MAGHRALTEDEAGELADLRRALSVALAVGDVTLNERARTWPAGAS